MLHLDISGQQEWGPELHLDVSTPQSPLLHLEDGSTKQWPELHLTVSGQQEPVQV